MSSETLINLCLDTIVSNFPRYNLAFTITEDDSIKRRFEFLQRKYSFDILSRLTTEGRSLEEKYVDLLINRYLKVLDTRWLENCSWEKVTSKIAEIGSNIEKTFFHDGTITDEIPWQDTICYFPNLKTFSYPTKCTSNYPTESTFGNPTKCIDLMLKHIAIFCPDIEEIDLGFSVVSSEGVKYLCKNENGDSLCTKLKKLCLEYTNIKEDDVKYLLQNIPSLEIIEYFDLPYVLYLLHKQDLPSLANAKPYNITALDLYCHCDAYTYYEDIVKVCLSLCPHLKTLTWSFLKNNEFNSFPKLPDLERLHINNTSVSSINIDKLLKGLCEKITSLSVIDCTLSLFVLSESCPRIKELCLNKVHFLVDDDAKPKFDSLTSLTFQNCSVSKNIKALYLLLTSSKKIESLTFYGCNLLSPEIKAHILKCCELNPVNKISFYSSRIDKEYIKILFLNCHTLSCLNIDDRLKNHQDELLMFAEILPNKPKINIRKCIACYDFEDDFDNNFDIVFV